MFTALYPRLAGLQAVCTPSSREKHQHHRHMLRLLTLHGSGVNSVHPAVWQRLYVLSRVLAQPPLLGTSTSTPTFIISNGKQSRCHSIVSINSPSRVDPQLCDNGNQTIWFVILEKKKKEKEKHKSSLIGRFWVPRLQT